MMGLVVANRQECAMPNIDAFMIQNRQNPDGSKETDVKAHHDMNDIFVSGKRAVKKDSLIKEFVAIIPAQISRNSIVVLQAKEAYYIPEAEDDKRSGGWLLKNTMPPELPDWPTDQEDILKPLGEGVYFLKTKDVDLETLCRVKNWHMYMPTDSLLRELNRPGNPQYASLAVAFHGRLSRPLVGVILVVLGLSVILRDQNRNVFISAGMCLLLCVVFFASIFACQYLGGREFVSPARRLAAGARVWADLARHVRHGSDVSMLISSRAGWSAESTDCLPLPRFRIRHERGFSWSPGRCRRPR